MPTPDEELSEHREEFHEALVFAYRDIPNLDRMLSFKMDIKRSSTIQDGPIEDMIFALMEQCEANIGLYALFCGALAYKPNSPKLKRMAEQYFGAGSTPSTEWQLPKIYLIETLQRIIQVTAPRVGRFENSQNGSRATGFLVAPDLFLCHGVVMQFIDDAATTQVRFPDLDTNDTTKDRVVSLAEAWKVAFSPEKDLNYLLIRLAESPGDDTARGNQRGAMSLAQRRSKGDANLVLLHFPEGGNLTSSFVSIAAGGSDSRLSYEYAASSGSSGAPCINSDFQVVAVHISRSRDGRRGEGIHASDIQQDLTRQGIRLPPI
jgi:hypothetical protein